MKSLPQITCFSLVGLAFGSPVFATNLLQNGSFEEPPGDYEYVPGGNFIPSGWQTILNGVEIFTSNDLGLGFPYPSTIPDGVKAVDLAPVTYVGGGLQQSFATTPNQTYDISFQAATQANWGKDGTGNVLAVVAPQVEVFPLVNHSLDLVWESKSFSFTATGTSSTLTFLSLDNPLLHVAALDGVSVVPSGGGVNLLTNGSFENPPGGYEYVPGGSSYIDGWMTQLNGVEIFTHDDIGLGFPYPTVIGDGIKAVDLAPFTYQGGGISQAFDTVPGELYEVTFLAATQEDWGKDGTGTIAAFVGDAFGYYPLLNWDSDFIWEEKTLSFNASGSLSTLTFLSLDDASSQLAAIDNVIATAVPESSSPTAVFGILLAGSVMAIRRRRQ